MNEPAKVTVRLHQVARVFIRTKADVGKVENHRTFWDKGLQAGHELGIVIELFLYGLVIPHVRRAGLVEEAQPDDDGQDTVGQYPTDPMTGKPRQLIVKHREKDRNRDKPDEYACP